MNTRAIGNYYEDAACAYLTSMGVEILERNFSCRLGEIDIIGIDNDTLVFFEIKYRKNNRYGDALEAVDIKKQKKIIKTAQFYLTFKNYDMYKRFDVVATDGNETIWIKNAFCI